MLFNSLEFILFLPTVFILYWFVFQRNLKLQNILIVVVSYFFYGWWDWRFLGLIALSSAVDYWCGLRLGHVIGSGQRERSNLTDTSSENKQPTTYHSPLTPHHSPGSYHRQHRLSLPLVQVCNCLLCRRWF